MWIERDVEARLRRAVRTRPVLVLTGARQTGKTSTLRRTVVGRSRIAGGVIVCRAPNAYPLANDFRAVPVTALA